VLFCSLGTIVIAFFVVNKYTSVGLAARNRPIRRAYMCMDSRMHSVEGANGCRKCRSLLQGTEIVASNDRTTKHLDI